MEQLIIEILIQKGIYKEEKTGRHLYELTKRELLQLMESILPNNQCEICPC
ncbi:Fur-regulated basic protein FbpA (plasmid) [Bacillus sp. JAS24-2]|uniref:Fur-regulated basic protein FbpA n=1 Tax=Bacillus sp. JAS24-2 TaxID=2217832 RepID=UPI0011EC38BD|nr:Fur-regulated basic protein FbpA [Bacillus sp. JAS24-2]QEL82869.1 Fur-regulated basic protein FbpA [Bacillus sp. JAS24-2]